MVSLIIDYIKKNKKIYLVIAISLVIYDASLVVPTKIIQSLIDQMTKSSFTSQVLWSHLAILIFATTINYGTAYLWHVNLFQEYVHFKFNLQQRAFKKLVHMRTPYYEKFRSGDMMTRFSTDVEALMVFIGYGLMIVLYAGGMIAFIIPTMFVISFKMSVIGMIPILMTVIATYLISKKQEELVEKARDAISNLSDEVLETVEGIQVMRAYGQKDNQYRHFSKKAQALADRWNHIASYNALYFPIFNTMIALSEMLILALGLSEIKNGHVTLGQVIALQLYLVSLVEPFAMLSDFILVYQTGKNSFGKVNELIESGDDMEKDGKQILDGFKKIELLNYSFSYANAQDASLQQVTLQVKKGQTLGIVGKTGSGKTTLVKQFLRQYPLGKGKFIVNGEDFKNFKRKSVEEQVAYVPQEHILFSKTVSENIAFGTKNPSYQDIAEAIATADFTKDLKHMPKGLETQIGERGLSISGGQKQRVSIARAFLVKSDLLILDDSLSAVDAKTETKIIANIQKVRKNKTTFIVSHRLSAVQHADWVIVLDQGRISEEGTPDDLLKKKGWYYEQYQRQQAQED
ncbi:ABC transporter ATP-binding protein [Streptococcus iniae]